MKKTIYHGSKQIIEKPFYGGGKNNNDYGKGFYCTFEQELANEWAIDFENDGYCNKYTIEDNDLKVLDLNNYPSLVWIAILLQNRKVNINNPIASISRKYLIDNFSIEYSDFDIIYGYRADDAYFDFARSFLNNNIPLSYLEDALKLGNLGNQYVIKSKKAFELIEFIEANKVDYKKYYMKKLIRDKVAKQLYSEGKLANFKRGDIFIKDIIEKGLTKNDF